MSWENYKKAVQSNMINRRYRQLFDKDDAIVDLETFKKDQTQIFLFFQNITFIFFYLIANEFLDSYIFALGNIYSYRKIVFDLYSKNFIRN